MGLVVPYCTYGTEDGGRLVYHNQSECVHGREIIRNGHKVEEGTEGRTLCDQCAELGSSS